MPGSIRNYLYLALIGICFITSCRQNPQLKSINEFKAAWTKAQNFRLEAERKRSEARQKSEPGDQAEHDRLVDEAANLYEQAAAALNDAAAKTDELAKLKRPEWYGEYFGLQSKLTRNFARLAAGAHDELLARKSGPISEAQEQIWKEELSRIKKEDDELSVKIKTIEKREGFALIKG